MYDFQGIKQTTNFYDNINRIITIAEGSQLVQYSVFLTRDQRAAKAAKDLVQHYDVQVSMFKGEIVEL